MGPASAAYFVVSSSIHDLESVSRAASRSLGAAETTAQRHLMSDIFNPFVRRAGDRRCLPRVIRDHPPLTLNASADLFEFRLQFEPSLFGWVELSHDCGKLVVNPQRLGCFKRLQ